MAKGNCCIINKLQVESSLVDNGGRACRKGPKDAFAVKYEVRKVGNKSIKTFSAEKHTDGDFSRERGATAHSVLQRSLRDEDFRSDLDGADRCITDL